MPWEMGQNGIGVIQLTACGLMDAMAFEIKLQPRRRRRKGGAAMAPDLGDQAAQGSHHLPEHGGVQRKGGTGRGGPEVVQGGLLVLGKPDQTETRCADTENALEGLAHMWPQIACIGRHGYCVGQAPKNCVKSMIT